MIGNFCGDGLEPHKDRRSRWVSHYNDNLMVLVESLATIGSGTRGFQKAQMGSNEN